MPVILNAADQGQVRLSWLSISPAAHEVTKLTKYQAAHNLSNPLESLDNVKQRQILKDVAFKIKEAVFGVSRLSSWRAFSGRSSIRDDFEDWG